MFGYAFLLLLLYLVLCLLQVSADLHESLPEVLYFLVLLGLYLIDGHVLLAVDKIQLDQHLLYFAFFLEKSLLKCLVVGFKYTLSLCLVPPQLLLQSLVLEFQCLYLLMLLGEF